MSGISPREPIDACLAEAIARYTDDNPLSLAQHRRASQSMPDGNTRSVLYSDPFPITLLRGRGAYVTSIDESEYVDYLGDYTAGLYGHSDPTIAAAIWEASQSGWVLGGHSTVEEQFAVLLRKRFKPLQRLRFTNSGTEANLMAITAALEHTARPAIVAFEGGYHGSVLNFCTARVGNLPFEFIVLPYNDPERFVTVARRQAQRIAAVLVEPMLGPGGCVPATSEFLRCLRAECDRHGALLIFDEVMTSRLTPGGLQSAYQITPDLMTLGKYLGGGLSSGVFGGRADVMQVFDPRCGRGNICSISAGLVGLRDVYTAEANVRLNRTGDATRQQLDSLILKSGLPMSVTGTGSMMHVHMRRGPITDYRNASVADAKLRTLFYYDLLESGIWSARRRMFCLSLPMGDNERHQLVRALDDFIIERCELFNDIPD